MSRPPVSPGPGSLPQQPQQPQQAPQQHQQVQQPQQQQSQQQRMPQPQQVQQPVSSSSSPPSGMPVAIQRHQSNAPSSQTGSPSNSQANFNNTVASAASGGGGGAHPERASILSGGDKESFIDMDRRSEVSGAGYSAYSGKHAEEQQDYRRRLERFYQKYNPEKITRVGEFLEAYKGEEEELFRTLTSKYGPEPEPSIVSASSSPAFRQVGVNRVPRSVSKEEGNCDRDTPYYPLQRTIMESDLCSLLGTKKTQHPDLLSTYVGYLPEHPNAAWNGLTYITNVPVPIDDASRFLGHLWAGSLSNTKTIVYEKIAYTRTVFHCNDQCSNPDWPHERWRLTLFRSDVTQDTLYRVLWDPVLSPAAAAELLKAAPNAVEQDRSFFSFFRRSKNPPSAGQQQPPPPPPAPRVAAGGAGGGGGGQPQQPSLGGNRSGQPPAYAGQQPSSSSSGAMMGNYSSSSSPQQPMSSSASPQQQHPAAAGGGTAVIPLQPIKQTQPGTYAGGPGSHPQQQQANPNSPAFQQPQQPQLVSTIDSLFQLVQGLEGRLTERLSDLDRRLQDVEKDVVLLKEVSEQRQIEQLPEPWLEDSVSQHTGSAGGGGSQKQNSNNHHHHDPSHHYQHRSDFNNHNNNHNNSGERKHHRSSKNQHASATSLSPEDQVKREQKMRRRMHRRRVETARNHGDEDGGGGGGGDADNSTVYTESLGTTIGGRSSHSGYD